MRYIPTPDEVVERLKKQAKKPLADDVRHLRQRGLGLLENFAHLVQGVAADGALTDPGVVRFDVEEVAQEFVASIPGDLDAERILRDADLLARALPHEAHGQVLVGLEQPGVADAGREEHEGRARWPGLGRNDLHVASQLRRDDGFAFIADRPHLVGRRRVFVALDDVMPVVVAGLLGDAIEQVRMLPGARTLEYVVDITDEVVARFLKKGWTEERVLELRAQGYRYSPGRDTLLGPIMSSDDIEDDDDIGDNDGDVK